MQWRNSKIKRVPEDRRRWLIAEGIVTINSLRVQTSYTAGTNMPQDGFEPHYGKKIGTNSRSLG